METKKSFVILSIIVCGLTAGLCQAAREKQDARQEQQASQVELRIKNQQQRITDINELVSDERQRIEERYFSGLSDLQRKAETEARKFTFSERLLWSEFIKNSIPTQYGDTYFFTGVRNFANNRKVFELRENLVDSYFLAATQRLLTDADAYKLLSDIVDSDNQNSLTRIEAGRILDVMEDLKQQSLRLQANRTAAIASLEQQEKDFKEDVFNTIRDIKQQPQTTELGVINAISAGGKNPVAMVGGEIVYPGSIIEGVKVAKILPSEIEFEKNGIRWTQKLTDAPKSYWK